MTKEEDIQAYKRIEAAIANGQMGKNDPLLPQQVYASVVVDDSSAKPMKTNALLDATIPTDTNALLKTTAPQQSTNPMSELRQPADNPPDGSVPMAQAINLEKAKVAKRFDDFFAKEGIPSQTRAYLEGILTKEDLQYIMYLWSSGKWSEHVMAMKLLGMEPTPEDLRRVKEEDAKIGLLLGAAAAGMLIVDPTSPFPDQAKSGNYQSITLQDAQRTPTPDEEEAAKEAKEDKGVKLSILPFSLPAAIIIED